MLYLPVSCHLDSVFLPLEAIQKASVYNKYAAEMWHLYNYGNRISIDIKKTKNDIMFVFWIAQKCLNHF